MAQSMLVSVSREKSFRFSALNFFSNSRDVSSACFDLVKKKCGARARRITGSRCFTHVRRYVNKLNTKARQIANASGGIDVQPLVWRAGSACRIIVRMSATCRRGGVGCQQDGDWAMEMLMLKRETPCVHSPLPRFQAAGSRLRRRCISAPMAAITRDALQRRRCWSTEELRYLDAWAGTRSVGEMCRRLQRSERALRCQLHRRGLSAKVCEGWGLGQLRTDMHLRTRTVLRYAVQGVLRVHSAQVCTKRLQVVAGLSRLPPWTVRAISLGEAARVLNCPRTQILMAALTGRCRLINVRITEASVLRLSASPTFSAIRTRLSPAIQRWLIASQKPCFH